MLEAREGSGSCDHPCAVRLGQIAGEATSPTSWDPNDSACFTQGSER
jgi:hypothetical protein